MVIFGWEESDKVFQALRDAGFMLMESEYRGTDTDGCQEYRIWLRSLVKDA